MKWVLKHRGKLIGEYRYLMAAMDASREYDESISLFDFDFYYIEQNGTHSRVTMI